MATEEAVIKKRMAYNEIQIRGFIQKSLEYISNWKEMPLEKCEEAVSNILCEIDTVDTLTTKIENQNLIEFGNSIDPNACTSTNSFDSQMLILKISNEIEEAKMIIEQKEQEYVNVQREKKYKEEFEQIAKQINKYPEVSKIEAKIKDKKIINQEIIDDISKGLQIELELRREQVKGLEKQLEEIKNWSEQNLVN